MQREVDFLAVTVLGVKHITFSQKNGDHFFIQTTFQVNYDVLLSHSRLIYA